MEKKKKKHWHRKFIGDIDILFKFKFTWRSKETLIFPYSLIKRNLIESWVKIIDIP